MTGRIKTDHDFNDEGMLFGGAPQEGLTPHHLKKAKLMFFYCRYPSSNVLKTYFPDVKVRFKNSLGVLVQYALQQLKVSYSDDKKKIVQDGPYQRVTYCSF